MRISWDNVEHVWRKQWLSDVKGEILAIAVGMGDNFKCYPLNAVATATDTSAKAIEKTKEVAKTRGTPGNKKSNLYLTKKMVSHRHSAAFKIQHHTPLPA